MTACARLSASGRESLLLIVISGGAPGLGFVVFGHPPAALRLGYLGVRREASGDVGFFSIPLFIAAAGG